MPNHNEGETKKIPEGMTAYKLRKIAGWMDILDRLLDDWEKDHPEQENEMRFFRQAGVQGNHHDEVQKDLNKWADELEAQNA